MGERHDLTYLYADESTDERTYERDARKLETVEAALFGRARCRLCESASRKADGDDDATVQERRAGARRAAVAGSALALGRSRAPAPDQRRRDLGARQSDRAER